MAFLSHFSAQCDPWHLCFVLKAGRNPVWCVSVNSHKRIIYTVSTSIKYCGDLQHTLLHSSLIKQASICDFNQTISIHFISCCHLESVVSSRSFRFSCSFSCHLTWPRFSMHFCQRWLRLQVNSHCGRFLWSKHELVKVLTLNWRCWFQEKKSRLLRDVFELVWICEETAAFVVAWDLIQATHQMKEQIDEGVQLQQFSASKDPVSLLIPFSPYRCVS